MRSQIEPGQRCHWADIGLEVDGVAHQADAVVVDTLPASSNFISATPSQGSCAESAGVVTCDLGTIASGGGASVDIVGSPEFLRLVLYARRPLTLMVDPTKHLFESRFVPKVRVIKSAEWMPSSWLDG